MSMAAREFLTSKKSASCGEIECQDNVDLFLRYERRAGGCALYFQATDIEQNILFISFEVITQQ